MRLDTGQRLSIILLLALLVGAGIAVVFALQAEAPSWPQVCRVVMPEDLDR
jgi:hypothetical protein